MLDTVTQLWYFTLNSHIAPKIQQHNKMERNMKALAILALLVSTSAIANPPVLIDPHTGKFLGNVSANRYDPNSVNNPHGRYGSKYSPDSINNPYSQYGSPYSPNSVNNQYYQAPAPVYVPNCYGC